MPVALRCPCGNLSFLLTATPLPVPTPPSFSSSSSTIKRFGRAELTVAGANWVWEVLVETKSVSSDWRVTRCLNCRTDCYAQRIGTQELLVNAELRPREEQPGTEGGLHWSSALGVAVETNPDVSNSLLEAPEVMDDRAVEVFQALQRVVESHVSTHTAEVHERIRAFEEEQREALSAFTINAYRDRKVLWHNICSALARRHTPASAAASSTSMLPFPASSTPSATAVTSAPASASSNISTSASSNFSSPATAPAPSTAPAAAPPVPVLPVVGDRSSPGPASAAVAEWLRAASSAAPLVASIHDSDSPRIVRANPAPSTSAAPSSIASSVPTSSSVATTNAASSPAPAPTPAPTSSTSFRMPSPRPRSGVAVLTRPVPVQLASSAPTAPRFAMTESDVFHLEEEDAVEAALPPGGNADDDDDNDKGSTEQTQLPPLRARAAYRELPALAPPSVEMLFGTSVPISIPPPRSAAPSAAPAVDATEDPSFDVPLSSTRRMKGYL